MGGVIALALALQHPNAVSRLVLYEAPIHAKKHWNVRMARKLGGVIALAKAGMHERAAARFYRFALEYKGGGNAFDDLDASMQKSALANARAVIAEVDAGTGEDLAQRDLERLSLPIGLIGGDRSAPFLQESVDRAAKMFPSARVIRIPGGDHMMTVRQPSALAQAIEDLLGDARQSAET